MASLDRDGNSLARMATGVVEQVGDRLPQRVAVPHGVGRAVGRGHEVPRQRPPVDVGGAPDFLLGDARQVGRLEGQRFVLIEARHAKE